MTKPASTKQPGIQGVKVDSREGQDWTERIPPGH